MRICGVDYSSNDLIPVVIESSEDGWKILDLTPTKITLNDLWDTEDVRLFAKTVTAFLAENQVDRVVVKKRATGGQYAGGAASFRMGALLQVSTEKPVIFMSSRAISSILQDIGVPRPEHLFKYQYSAYKVAVAYVQREFVE